MIILEMIREEFDKTLTTDPYFSNKDVSTLVRDIHGFLLLKKQELCTSIDKELCELIGRLPYPLTPDQTEALSELRRVIRSLTSKDELIFRMMVHAGERMLNALKEETNE